MKINVSQEAKEKLNAEKKEGQFLYLRYDTEGCGCANDGIFYLTLSDKSPNSKDIVMESDGLEVYVSKMLQIYLTDELQLAYNPETLTFRLSNKEQIINARMRLRR